MIVRAIIPNKGPQDTEPIRYLIEATGDELDKINGIADVAHISDRYKVNTEVQVGAVYDKLAELKDNLGDLPNIKAQLQNSISAITNAETLLQT